MSSRPGEEIDIRLPKHWKWCYLDDLKSIERRSIISGPFGSSISSKFFVPNGIPVIRGNNLSLSMVRYIDKGYVFITEEKANELNTWAEKNDILFTAAGTIGQVGIIGDNTKYKKYIISNKQLRVRLNAEVVLPLYVYYWLASPLMVEYIQQRNTGSTIPLINLSIIKNLPVPVPPLSEQEKIVSILSSLDDKIELNRQINATLEAITQAIFKEWFVDFNFPGATGEMVESELGMIPKEWRVGILGEVCKLVKGVSYRRSELQPSKTALVTLKSINRGGGFNSNGFKEFTGKYNASQIVAEGDLVFAQTDITQNADIVGSPAIVENPQNYKTLIASLDMVKCKPENDMPSSETLFHFLKRQEFKEYCLSNTNGSTVLHLRSSEVPKYSLIIPTGDLLKKFDKIATSIRQNIFINNRQTQLLSEIRDLLLPKLMSGEIEV